MLSFFQAVCCSDHVHCCPHSHTCDVQKGICRAGDLAVPWSTKVKAMQSEVVCPGGQQVCQEGQTCCKLVSGQYGCCPYPDVSILIKF